MVVIALTVLTAVGLIVMTVVGYLRSLQRGLMVLAGTFLGASVVDFWANDWGQRLAERWGSEQSNGWTLAVSLLLFLTVVIVVGYGGGSLINSGKGEAGFRKVESALVGALNGALAMGFVVRFIADSATTQRDAILASAFTFLLYTGLPYLVLVIAATITVLALVNLVLRLVRRSAKAAPAKTSATAATPAKSAPPTPPATPTAPATAASSPKSLANPDQQQLQKLMDQKIKEHIDKRLP